MRAEPRDLPPTAIEDAEGHNCQPDPLEARTEAEFLAQDRGDRVGESGAEAGSDLGGVGAFEHA
ncbi:hypothetical protein OIE67_15390 [Nonomuraea fuscirosea]|uniref:hypothetical protein n=1 Tax=Nonomuraea fuscirosea TaxID=1291556 RepID=UPI002DD9D36B|nr:hypothetical protein [Nonomuraea fuscirosea]WSA55935.1 hypothetical protein OIE67_15390 [Nonomuraea fuscirosea]